MVSDRYLVVAGILPGSVGHRSCPVEGGPPRAVTPDVAAANTDVQSIIAPRIKMLMEIANSFLTTIMESIDQVPYGIRWICKQIRSLTKVSITYQ